jgi:hypothetical protein
MEDNQKSCGRCKEVKSLSDFNKSKHGTKGVHGHCRDCQKAVKREWYEQNKQKCLDYCKQEDVKEKALARQLKKYHSDDKYRKASLKKNRDRRRTPEAREKARLQRQKWMAIPKNRIAQSLRGRIRNALNGGPKSDDTRRLLGCDFEFARTHLEAKFSVGMSWENYGEWEIDHIVPCNFFDLSKEEHQRMCFNYRNLQPMWKNENQSKCDKVTIDNLDAYLTELKDALFA